MRRKQRSLNQVKEDISIKVLRDKLPDEWVIHSYGADYGIDCVVELFDYVDEKHKLAETLGENFFVQLKASDRIEYSTRRTYSRGNVAKGPLTEDKSDFIDIPIAKFQLDTPELLTIQSMGVAIPVLLILVDTKTRKAYFLCINDYIDKVLIPEDPDFAKIGSKIIYIPLANEILPTDEKLLPLRTYGKRSKMYGAFGVFNYQYKEIQRACENAGFLYDMNQEQVLDMIHTFAKNSLRQDIWSGHNFWKPIAWSHTELLGIENTLKEGISSEDYQQFLSYCSGFVWHRLTNLADMYEELVREWFLPTYLAQLLSYPGTVETNG